MPLGPAKHLLHQLAEEGSKVATPALGYARVTIWLPRPARAWQGRHAGLEARQGLRIACPEEICWRNGWIDDAQLEKLGNEIGKSQYGQYLLQILRHRD